MNRRGVYSAGSRMSDLVGDNYSLLMVLSRFGISLGFSDRSVDEVCRNSGVDTATFLAIVNTMLDKSYNPFEEGREISIECFLEYLHNSHTFYLKYRLPELRKKLIEAIDCRHGDIAFAVLRFFDEYADEVRRHLEYEESTVFPYVKGLTKGVIDPSYSIRMFSSQHDHIADKLSELKSILVQYYPAEDSFELNDVLFDLFSSEDDLAMHNYIEDHIFVPAVQRLENECKEDSTQRSSESVTERQEVLSQREKEIIVCVVKGMTNKQIADTLCISTHTVITHRRNIAAKLQIRSAAGLTIYAIVHKLVELNDVKQSIYNDDKI
ncbi:MAG: helix-turn-helix transcriptional regulator [Alistipes sp.]|nr:helix-turn-helix transcriptional regulator [Alistipes sp.]